MDKKIKICGIDVGVLTRTEIAQTLFSFAHGERIRTAFYLNAHCLNIALKDPQYYNILRQSDLVYAGGQGIVWASKFLGNPLPERVTMLDFFDILAEKLRIKKTSIYLFGNTQEVVKEASRILKNQGLNIVGYRNGFFENEQEQNIIQEINSLRPNILIVGLGVPKQEKWIFSHLRQLQVNLCWAVGAAFDWISGKRKRAPKWIRDSGFEWLHRLCQQPLRLSKRYLVGNPLFIYRIIKQKINK